MTEDPQADRPQMPEPSDDAINATWDRWFSERGLQATARIEYARAILRDHAHAYAEALAAHRVALAVAAERERWHELVEQLVACHGEATCPALDWARDMMAEWVNQQPPATGKEPT